MVGRLLIGLLVLVSALVGATGGLLLVYSTDLPQVDQLQHYRPSSITELYDDQGRIFTLYANQIYLGHGVYGFEAASQFYFSKPSKQLTLDEATLLAGLPKSPSYYSPITHPERALRRRNLVINSMLEDGMITAQQAAAARDQPIRLEVAHEPDSLAPYFVEELRRYLEAKYGSDQVHEGGLKVYASLDVELQRAANRAVLDGLAAYERRHGWNGHLQNILTEDMTLADYQHPDWDNEPEAGGYVHALVIAVSSSSV